MENKREHLPLFGVGPIIIYGQFVFTAISIVLTFVFDIKISIEWLRIFRALLIENDLDRK